MQGVEILTSTQVMIEYAFDQTAFWITLITIFGLCLVIGVLSVLCDNEDTSIIPFLALVGIILGTLTGAAAGLLADEPVTYETQYKVTISDEVSMTEFYEHYEVIEQDGKIFTVREKER